MPEEITNILVVLEILIIPMVVLLVVNYSKTLSLENEISNVKLRLEAKESAFEQLDTKVDELVTTSAVIKNTLQRMEKGWINGSGNEKTNDD